MSLRFVSDAHHRRVLVKMAFPFTTRAINISTQPGIVSQALAAAGAGEDAPSGTRHAVVGGWVCELATAVGAWHPGTAQATSLDTVVGGAAFPVLGAAYERHVRPLREIPMWAAPILGQPTARSATEVAFGAKATRPVVSAFASSLTRPGPGAPHRDQPSHRVNLTALALALMGSAVLEPDQLARVLRRARPAAVPSGEQISAAQRALGRLGRHRAELPRNIQNGVVSRLKVMAGMNIAEHRLPQDGRITNKLDGHPVDLRVATLPSVHGEKVVMRVLDNSTAKLNLADLGFLPENMRRYSSSYTKPYGTVLVTGPTGSGKTTTLYATLNLLNQSTKNVITVEDPVEYQVQGITQMQVNNRTGLSFALALRTILRADPDIILVGEIRDRETAAIAIEAALTGHLVLSTLHTNDASTTANRLIEMGVEPFLVGSALDCIVAQRLARKLCERCKQAYDVDRGQLSALGWDLGDMEVPPHLFRAVGCQRCGNTGYAGRFAVHEVLNVNEEIERMIVEHAHADDIRKAATADGMLTLRQAGLMGVAGGITSLDEVLRVIS